MNNLRNWIIPAALAVAMLIYVSSHPGGVSVSPQTYMPAPGSVSGSSWSHGYDGSSENAEEHWQKHGGEFPGLHSEQDYVRAANAFVHRPPSDVEIKHDARGDTLFYEPSSDTFAVMDAQGEPRTFFKPDNGARYWDRQCCSN